jgi:HD superfamily phosphohydrolase
MKAFFYTLFVKQNKYHKYSVLRHTLEVVKFILKYKRYNMILAGLLHDIGKPFVAHQDEDDLREDFTSYSFTGHEEKSYQIIKNWFFISKRTKLLVRHHYLITGMAVYLRKYKTTGNNQYLESYVDRLKLWHDLPPELKHDLLILKICDDKGKGYDHIQKAVPRFLEKEHEYYEKLLKG